MGSIQHRNALLLQAFFPYDSPKYSCVVLMLGANRGAARSSGIVLKNVALKMYSRGLLGNVSDYRAETKQDKTSGVIYASKNAKSSERVKKEFNLGKMKNFREPKIPAEGVPGVVGLGLKDAISILESKGLYVKFSGNGYVHSQSLASGSKYKKGDIITLTLKQ